MDTVERKQRLRSWKQSKQIHYSEKLISQHACFILARLNRLEAKGEVHHLLLWSIVHFHFKILLKKSQVGVFIQLSLNTCGNPFGRNTTFKRIPSSPSVSFPFLRAVLRNQMLMFPIYWWENKRNMQFCAKSTIWMLLGKYGLGPQYRCSLLFVVCLRKHKQQEKG